MALNVKKITERLDNSEKVLESLRGKIAPEEFDTIKNSLNDIKWNLAVNPNKENEGTVMATLLSDFVNGSSSEFKNFIEYTTKREHRTLQQITFGLMLKTLKAFAELPDHMTDDRNACTVRKARQIAKFMESEGISENMPLI